MENQTTVEAPQPKPTFNKKVAKEIAKALVKEVLDSITGEDDGDKSYYSALYTSGASISEQIEAAITARGISPTDIRVWKVADIFDAMLGKVRKKAIVQFAKWHSQLR